MGTDWARNATRRQPDGRVAEHQDHPPLLDEILSVRVIETRLGGLKIDTVGAGRHDDQVDALSICALVLMDRPTAHGESGTVLTDPALASLARLVHHAILGQVTRGLDDGPHTYEVNDLYASGFDPVFTERDLLSFVHEGLPDELLEQANPRQVVLDSARGPLRRYLARRWLRGKDDREIARALAEHLPEDVKKQQELVAEADAFIFVAPVFWMAFPAILKGWFERVFAYGFAYTLTRQGDLDGRVPLLSQEKALIITPTFFTENEYDKGWREAMDTVISDWGLKMAGVKQAEHKYFYAVVAADDEQRRVYLDEAYRLGRDF